MMVTTAPSIEGFRIRETKGIVRGLIVRSPTLSQGVMGGLKTIVGGENEAFTGMCEQTRAQAYDMLVQHAEEMGDAVIGLRYETSELGQGLTEVLCYGTAVIIETPDGEVVKHERKVREPGWEI